MGGGLLVVATGVLPFRVAVAVAGVHLAVLGPVLHGLLGDPNRTTTLAVGLLLTLLVMCTGIVAGGAEVDFAGVQLRAPALAAWSGGVLALGRAVGAVTWGAAVDARW